MIRRLNRQEYNNTVRDLLGIDLNLADAFPPDDIGFGYDNVGSALNISPVHVEKYLDAAELALQRAIVPPDAEELPPVELIGLKTYPLPPTSRSSSHTPSSPAGTWPISAWCGWGSRRPSRRLGW